MRPASVLLVALALATASGPDAARAQSPGETRLREALRTTATQLRALEEERDKWQATEASLKAENESLRSQLAAAKRAPAPKRADCSAAEGRAEDLSRRLAEQTQAAGKLTESLRQCQSAAENGDKSARAKEEERAALATEATALKERLAASDAKNEKMFRVGKELLDWLEREGFSELTREREPLLGLKRVDLENAAQDFEDKLLEQRVKR